MIQFKVCFGLFRSNLIGEELNLKEENYRKQYLKNS